MLVTVENKKDGAQDVPLKNIPSERVAGRYQLIRRIGNGNMSTVYEAEDTRRSNRIVAVKLLNTEHDDALKQEIFRRESKALSQLEHPNIVNVLDYGWSREDRCHYLVFEYIPRTLLDEIAAHQTDQDHSWCWPLMREMTTALVHAHSQGIIHRDIKPSNVLIAADGQSKLVDFGVSWLKYELGTGVTVSSFWSIGYASPEQRLNQTADERSDIYSLGCVFYHMLSRSAPHSGGITERHIDALRVPTKVKRILLKMLAPDPSSRYQQAVQLRRQIELTQKFELLPEVYFLVTERARRDLFNQGDIEQSSMEAACNFLLEELGGDDPKEVHISLEHDGIRLLTDTLRLICSRDPGSPFLIIKAIHVLLYQPQLEQQRNQAIPLRFLWQVIDQRGITHLSSQIYAGLDTTLNTLFEKLATHQAIAKTARKRHFERKDLTKTWEAVLKHHHQLLTSVPKLPYRHVARDGDSLSFLLQDAAPDNLPWPENAPIAVMDPDVPHLTSFVGHIQRIDGKMIYVSRDAGDINRPIPPAEKLPSPGLLSIFQQEAKIALERQQTAVEIVRSGSTVNPRLPDVLLDLGTAEFDELDPNLTFVQQGLAPDKQQAVRQALAARDLFLLQGPPGTGKTTTLAEIILQILKIKPDARILVASQSNVAVNHVLSRVAELQGGSPLEIVRIGRSEKIGHGAQIWTIDQRLSSWRDEIIARTDPVVHQLKKRLQERRREHKAMQQASPELLDDLQDCQNWLEELASEIEDLVELDSEEAQKKTEELTATLALIRATLPAAIQGEVKPTLAEERERLSNVITNFLSPGFSESREARLLTLVERWRMIFGKQQQEFAKPILERASILAATCLIAGGYYLKDQEFDWAIVDEAGRATTPELLVSLVRARHAIIVGDEKQLPPMLDEELSDRDLAHLGTSREELTESLFATLVAQGKEEGLPAVQMLVAQHRMHPAIGKMISSVFYGGKLTHAVSEIERTHKLPWLARPVAWFSTGHLPRHFETPSGQSFYNRVEIEGISSLLHQMERSYREIGERREVAVITPYNAQIVELLAEIIPGGSSWQALSIEIATIDAFQGRDRDIVLYSPVRSNKGGSLGFLRDRRRLNVALSRAREALLIIGDIWTLERGRGGALGNPYQELIRYLRTHPQDCLIEDLNLEVPNA